MKITSNSPSVSCGRSNLFALFLSSSMNEFCGFLFFMTKPEITKNNGMWNDKMNCPNAPQCCTITSIMAIPRATSMASFLPPPDYIIVNQCFIHFFKCFILDERAHFTEFRSRSFNPIKYEESPKVIVVIHNVRIIRYILVLSIINWTV